jgi:hypothetical protein
MTEETIENENSKCFEEPKRSMPMPDYEELKSLGPVMVDRE